MKSLTIAFVLASLPVAAQLKINIPGAATPSAGDEVIEKNGVTQSITCAKNTVFLRGNDGHFTIAGTCHAVHVLGNGNVVTIVATNRLVVEGNKNSVTYNNPNTGVSVLGNENKVAAARE